MPTHLVDGLIIPIDKDNRYVITSSTYADMPYGDCYVPQVLLSWGCRGWNITPLNCDAGTVEEITQAAYRLDDETFIRYVQAMHGGMVVRDTGYSQGDIYMVALLPTSEWYAMTGAAGIDESDAMDAINWARGDCWQVEIQSRHVWQDMTTGATETRWETEDYGGTQYGTTTDDLDIPTL